MHAWHCAAAITPGSSKRMFGMLMGTLKVFQQSAAPTKSARRAAHTTPPHIAQEAKLAEISTKLAQATQAEREQFRAQKTELLESRKQKRHEIAVLMLTKEINDNVRRTACRRAHPPHQMPVWEQQRQQVSKFIKTTAEPRIFFLPVRIKSDVAMPMCGRPR